MRQKLAMIVIGLFLTASGAMAQTPDNDADHAMKVAWLKLNAAQSLNAMIGQHKDKASNRQQSLQAFFDAQKLTDDYKASGYDKKTNPNNYSFDQLYKTALHNEAKQGLPPIPGGMSLETLQSEANAAIDLAQQNYDALTPMVDANQDMQGYLKSKDQWDAYNTWAAQQVKDQKAAYQKWLKQAKQENQKDKVAEDPARRKAMLAISNEERDERAANLQQQLQVLQAQSTANQQAYAVKQYHPVYGWGDPYNDTPWRYGGYGWHGFGDDGMVPVPANNGGNQNIGDVGGKAMDEANQQLNDADAKRDASQKAANEAEKAFIDAQEKTQGDVQAADDQMPADGEVTPSDVVPNSPTNVTQDANKEASELVPDVQPRPGMGPQQPAAQPAEQPQQPAEQPQQPAS